jgi:hypothetical protein
VDAVVENPRRNPRIPVRLRVVVSHAGAGWSAETTDVSLHGCQIVTPRPMKLGEVARLVIEGPGGQSLSVFGKVAWVADQGRFRAGITYAERQPDGDPGSWFRRLVAVHPGGEGAIRKVPDRLPVETRLFLRPPPRFIFDFGPDEVALIRAVGDGSTVSNVMRGGTIEPDRAARAIFALLEKRVLTLSLGEAAPAWKWKAALADFEAQAGERRAPPAPTPAAPPPAARVAPPPPSSRPEPVAASSAVTSPPAPAPRTATAPPETAAEEAPSSTTPAPESSAAPAPTASVPAPRPGAVRSAEAQECFDLAVSAVSMGEISTAIGLLRRALQLSPRDPEISALLGQLAFRDRQVIP